MKVLSVTERFGTDPGEADNPTFECRVKHQGFRISCETYVKVPTVRARFGRDPGEGDKSTFEV